ncbi:amidohydrolase [Rhizobium sp. CNPSo 3968]|uniref:amidohydrolase n=1 Tax=Rhizobium sp. CNPSo 3968 TaxID=3021408 RepID=UPI00255095FD|nr:amidohydrolase [Rhizobium sp. CNPSo 3968]MDK4717896.1 amidohydrolase [Rhizobium sp. CNPSo 3968]
MSVDQAAIDSILEGVEAAVSVRAARYAQLADEIWEFAELGFEETRSSKAQIEMLAAEGFRVTVGIGGLPTAFVAERGAGKPVIGLLGEFDALAGMSQVAGVAKPDPLRPGSPGHGCGHNLLGTGSALAAVAAAETMESLGIPGTIRYYGCPAEEGGGGKAFMARAGVFDDLDAGFSWHPGPASSAHMNRTNAFLQVRVVFLGRSSHAALTPHLGRSALDAAELMNMGCNYLREHMEEGERIHYAYRDSGGIAANVVQSKVELAYIVRSRSVEGLQLLATRVEQVARGAAMMSGTEVEFTIESGMSPYQPNLTLTKMMHEQFTAVGSPDFDEKDIEAAAAFTDTQDRRNRPLDDEIAPLSDHVGNSLGSTDVGDASIVTPFAQIWVASFARGTAFHSWQLVAQGKLPAAHKGMLQAAKVMAGSAVRAIQDADLLERARQEHLQRNGGARYNCPIPDHVLPPLPRSQARE